ncbi:MAG: recombinase family protein [Lachnospiraceae bacterium]|nr:recombinase family protein [Lachnospiraceae bacterium]
MAGAQERISDRKQKIRERYKGVSEENLDCIPAVPQEDFYRSEKRKRVAVYARVSTDDPNQTSSYELQKNYYEDMVTKKDNWELVDIYADEGISGTSLAHRDSFKRMIADCMEGKIDLIVTKSVSRFARNILDCIGYVRELKSLDPQVGVFFETENIYTLDDRSEMALSFIATLAQEESHSKSEIMNASVEMRFKRGVFITPVLLGYDHNEEGELVINESEAATVRIIFFSYMYGYSTAQIADALTELERKTKKGNTSWSSSSIYQILTNERYCGDVLARKTFTPNYLDHKSKRNRNERNKYRQKDHHEAIISREDFFAVQKLIRLSKYGNKGYYPELKVVKNGILTGYVTVHPKWAAFEEDDYYFASEQVMEGIVKRPSVPMQLNVEKGSVDLSGYELVRRVFLSAMGLIQVTFNEDHFVFNMTAVNKMPDVRKIEILVMPHKKLMAIRPAAEGSRYGILCSREKDRVVTPNVINGRAYLPTLYKLFGWREEAEYKICGTFQTNSEERFLLFDMTEAIKLVRKEPERDVSDLKRRIKKEREYPSEWGDSFGEKYYTGRIKHASIREEMEISGITEDAVYNLGDEGVTSAEDAAVQMEKIIREITGGDE